jgi:hypothetical protein
LVPPPPNPKRAWRGAPRPAGVWLASAAVAAATVATTIWL